MHVHRLIYHILGLLYISVTINAHAAPTFSLGLPLSCSVGKECYIQNYVDTIKGEQYADYHCQKSSYNKHKGTDFTIRSRSLHTDPVSVIDVADGTVLGIRNHIPDLHPDFASERYKKTHLYGTECGNGLVIQHKDGYQTQYCHMKQGSLVVKNGQRIRKGDPLGHIGLSGHTEFPHLHLSVRKNNIPIDPFTSKTMESGCSESDRTSHISMWDKDITSSLGYTDTAIVDFGIKSNLPMDAVSARSGLYHNEAFSSATKQALVWVDILRPTKGDIIEIILPYPNGSQKTFTHTIDKTQARRFQYLGTKTPPKGRFSAHSNETIRYRLKRNNTIIDEKSMPYPTI